MRSRRPFLFVYVFFAVTGVFFVAAIAGRIFSQRKPSIRPERGGVKMPPPEVVQALCDPRTRLATIREVGEKKLGSAVPLLRGFTKDEDAQVRRAATRALGQIGSADAVYALRVRLNDKDVAVRREAALALGNLGESGDAAAIYSLMEGLEDEDVGVRVAAVQGLGNISSIAATEALTRALRAETPREVRLAAVSALSARPGDEASHVLGQCVRDTDAEVRGQALKALAQRRDPGTYPALVAALDDDHPQLRKLAADAVERIGEPILDRVCSALPRARHIEARIAVVSLLAKARGEVATAGLLRLLENMDARYGGQPTKDLWNSVVQALGERGSSALDAMVKSALEGESSPLAEEAAAEICRRIGKPAVEPIVRSILRWKLFLDTAELKLWVKALGDIGDPAAVEALDFALGQDIDGMDALVSAARASIEAKSGVKLPAAKPVAFLPEVGTVDFGRLPSVRRLPDPPATTETNEVPDEGVLVLCLRGALRRVWQSADRPGADVQMGLERRDGRWIDPSWGHGYGYNVRYHPCRVVESDLGQEPRMKIEMFVIEDEWVPGGYAEYEVRLKRDGAQWTGAYEGHYCYRPVKGEVAASCRKGRIMVDDRDCVASGEHPRLQFRRGDLPALRARARTDLGRAVIRAIREKISYGKVEDWNGEVDGVTTWAPGLDRAMGMAFLALLLEDGEMGRRAVMTYMPRVRMQPYLGEHGEVGVPHIHNYGFAFDLLYPFLSDREREEAKMDLHSFWGYIAAWHGMLGNMTAGSPPGGYMIPGPGVLAIWREKGPFLIGEPRPLRPVTVLDPDPNPAQGRGPMPNVYAGDAGRMMTNWLVAGPFPTNASEDVLAHLGGAAKARPEDGERVPFRGVNYSFVPLPSDAIRRTPGFGGKETCVVIPAADLSTRVYLYGLLRVDQETGVLFDCTFPVRFASARAWFNGRETECRSLLILRPGLHRVMVELVGAAFSPHLSPADAYYLMAQHKKEDWRMQQFRRAKAQHERDGELAGIPLMVEPTRRALRDILRLNLERSLSMDRPPRGGHLWSVANAFAHVMGEPLSRDVPFPVDVRPDFIPQLSDEDLCYALLLVSERVKPAVVDEFNRRFLPGELRRLPCRLLITALANYPMDVSAQAGPRADAGVSSEPGRGQYTFRGGSDPGGIALRAFARTSLPLQAGVFVPRAGSFTISSGDMEWLTEHRDYQNVLDVEPSRGDGLGKVAHYEPGPDGSGSLTVDMSGVYSHGGVSGIEALRAYATDFSGRSGAPFLFALMDRVKGGKAKAWSFYLHGEGTNMVGNVFVARQVGAGGIQNPADVWNVRGTVVGSGAAPPRGDSVYRRKQFGAFAVRAATEDREAALWMVLTIQKGPAPEIKVTGKGENAVFEVGGQRVSFDGKRIAIGLTSR